MRPAPSKVLLGLAIVLAVGCKSSTSPGIHPEIVNNADHFSYQVSDMQSYSADISYVWQNGGTQATLNQACAVRAGTATLILLDANGTQVYSRALSENGTFTTASGVAGAWTIRVVYDNASATINFRADRTT